jgi:hypothetical protein
VPLSDDERFENYLRQFRPLYPEALHTEKRGGARRRLSAFAAWVAAAVVVLTLAVVMMRSRSKPTHFKKGTGSSVQLEQLANPQPLTIGSANALLARAPSFKAVVDQIAYRPQTLQPTKGTQRLLAVLSKEDTNL